MRDYYEILQVHHRAIPEIIEKAYRVLVRKYHPDLHPADKKDWAELRMKELNIAYATLSDPAKRDRYDAEHPVVRHTARTTLEPNHEGLDEIVVKCFNHPIVPAKAFCFQCGRPVCEQCLDASQTHPRCVTCVGFAAAHRRRRAVETVAAAEPELLHAMGLPGALLFYLGAAAIGAIILAFVIWVAQQQVEELWLRRAVYLALAVAGLYWLLREFAWRYTCPRCQSASSQVQLRAAAPWSEFFHPEEVCPHCGRDLTTPPADYEVD